MIYNEDCLTTMARLENETIDLVVTSPPYDDLRKYNGYSFDFEAIAKELWRTIKPGGVVVWVVGDATVQGSETGTSFKQALYFKELGFNLHDTMIWEKTGRLPTQDRYYAIFEYMFIFSKGKPKAMNFIVDHQNVKSGQVRQKDTTINKGQHKRGAGTFVTKEFSRRPNIWKMHNKGNGTTHPAVFPQKLAYDHIITWSNPGDLVYDPFMGSGTTAIVAQRLGRRWFGSEISSEYCDIIFERMGFGEQEISQIIA